MASRKALLLGAGFVVKPTLTLLSDKGVEVTVGATMIHHAVDQTKVEADTMQAAEHWTVQKNFAKM